MGRVPSGGIPGVNSGGDWWGRPAAATLCAVAVEFPVTVVYLPGSSGSIPVDIDQAFRDEGLSPVTNVESKALPAVGGPGLLEGTHTLWLSLDWIDLAKIGVGITLGSFLKKLGERIGDDAWSGFKKGVQNAVRHRADVGDRVIELTIWFRLSDRQPTLDGYVAFHFRSEGDARELRAAVEALDGLEVKPEPCSYQWDSDGHRWESRY